MRKIWSFAGFRVAWGNPHKIGSGQMGELVSGFSSTGAGIKIVRSIMKNPYGLALALTLGLVLGVEGQTTFKNLGFEVGVPVPIPNDPSGRVYAENAFPHWTAYIGTNAQTAVL